MKETVFTKYSGERSKSFAICTNIVKENDSFAVEKYPLYPEGKTHIEKISKWYHLLQETYKKEDFLINKCSEISGGIRLEYLPGVTLQEEIRNQKQEQNIEAYIEQYLERMMGNQNWIPFQPTQEFSKVFGEVSLPENLKCQKITNIDMIFSNIILEGEKWHIIDYEWTFDFPIPIHFVLYRAFFLAFHEIPNVKCLEFCRMMKHLGISIEEQEVYQKMEESFQEYVRGGEKPFRDILLDLEQPVISMKQVERTFADCGGLKCTTTYYKGNHEILSEVANVRITEEDDIRVVCHLPKESDKMKFQISPGSCMIQMNEILLERDSKEEKEMVSPNQIEVNGITIAEGLYLMLSDEAWIQIACQGAKKIAILIKVQQIFLEMNQELVPHITNLHAKLQEAYDEISYLKLRYDRVEHSKLFQAYLKAKEIRDK